MTNYQRLGDYIQAVNVRNTGLITEDLRGLSMTKELRKSTSNIVGTDLSKYKLVGNNQFACDFMSVIRVHKLPVVLHQEEIPIIVSPAYTTFEVSDEKKLLPEYLMMWFRRSEFDRYADFRCDSAIRGGFKWEELCEVELPIPSIEKQQIIVDEYNAITKKINLNEQLNQKLEQTAQSLYKHWFVDFEFPNEQGKPYKSNGGEMVYNAELDKEIPKGWEVGSFLDVVSISGGGTPSTQISEYWNGNIPFFTPADVGKSYYTLLTEKHLTDLGLSNCSSKLYLENTIIVTARGTVGAVALLGVPMAMNQSCYAFFNRYSFYGHQFVLQSIVELTSEAVGAVFNALVTNDFKNKEVLLVSNLLQGMFHKKVTPLYEKIILGQKLNIKLQQLKNLLLSKMSRD